MRCNQGPDLTIEGTTSIAGKLVRIRVWDVPVRCCHWGLVVLIPISWWTANTGFITAHSYSGYAVLALLVFRVYWGFFGSSTARFSEFVYGPRRTWSYIKNRKKSLPMVGHNPLGALSVIAMLLALFGQIALGLFSTDEFGIDGGPLSFLVSYDTAQQLRELHEWLFNIVLALIALHLSAVFYYHTRKQQNKVKTMISGYDEVPRNRATSIEFAPAYRIVIGAGLSAVVIWMITNGLFLPI